MGNRKTGEWLAREWGLSVQQALYRKSGDWYHQLRRFPGALLDAGGFKVFPSIDAFRECPQLQIQKDVHVPGGIREISGYVLMVHGSAKKQDESSKSHSFLEGRATEIVQTRYERSRQARNICLSMHGCACRVCGLDFEERYGELGRGFIHVHHVEKIALAEDERPVDPAKDLVPVCPNCHAMLHRRSPPLTPSALVRYLRRSRGPSLSGRSRPIRATTVGGGSR